MRTTARRFLSMARAGLVITTFTQSLGAELLTNGNMETGSPPSSWSSGNSAVLAAAAEERTGGSGVQSLRIERFSESFSYAFQNVSSALNRYYEMTGWLRNVNAQYIRLNPVGSETVSPSITSTSWTNTSLITRSPLSTFQVSVFIASSTNGQYALADDVSFKQITLNTQQVANVNATHTFRFTLPVSPIAGHEVHLCYRIAASDPFLNGWDAYLIYSGSAWDFRLDSISAGTRTNRVSVTSVGTPDAIRVVTSGNNHSCFTGVSGTYTARGSTVTNSTHNTSTGINTIYSSAVTPVELRSA